MSLQCPHKSDSDSDSSHSDSNQSNHAQTSSRHHHNGKKNKSRSKKSWDCIIYTPRDQCLHAARWIPCAFNMCCNLNEVIQITLALKAEDTGSEWPARSTLEKRNHYQHIYGYLKEHAPYFVGLIKKRRSGKTELLMREMQQVISWTRSDDASHLRSMISSYAAPHPDKKLVDPPVNARGSKDRLGFNHLELTCLLFPVRNLQGFLEDLSGVKKQLQNGSILITAQKWLAFLYSGDIADKILKHIFMSPSSALPSGKVRNTHASNVKIHHMAHVEAYHITYNAVHACFSICSQDKFTKINGQFSFPKFYYQIIDFIINNKDEALVEELISHYNKLLFNDVWGTASNEVNVDDEDDNLAIMRQQIAAHLASSSGTSSHRPNLLGTLVIFPCFRL
ncbi:hypothetical protein F5141DRAFT_1060129 [Pisolithus sp. B1]|nr:hypothetical protein F5141DRAFT_1060129 [Pisolithus sp. B1]